MMTGKYSSNLVQSRTLLGVNRAQSSSDAEWGIPILVVILIIWIMGFWIGFMASLVVSVVVGFGASIIGLWRPGIGLFGIGILCALDAPMRAFLLTGGLLRWNTFNYFLLIALILNVIRLFRLKVPHVRFLFLLIFLLSVELINSSDVSNGIVAILQVVSGLGLLVYFGRANADRRAWYWMSIITSVLTAIGTLVFITQMNKLPYFDPNSWSFFPLTGIFAICLGIPFTSNRRQSFFSWTLVIVNLGWVFLSGSRGSLLDASLGVFLVLMQMKGISKRVFSLGVGILLLFFLSNQFAGLQANAITRFEKFVNTSYSLSSRTSGRSDLFLAGWNIFRAHPLGIGTGSFQLAWKSLGGLGGSLVYYQSNSDSVAHSAWLRILTENGILGIALFALYIFSFAGMGLRQELRSLVALGMLVTLILAVAFLSTEFSGKALWFLASGATVLLYEKEIDRVFKDVGFRKKYTYLNGGDDSTVAFDRYERQSVKH